MWEATSLCFSRSWGVSLCVRDKLEVASDTMHINTSGKWECHHAGHIGWRAPTRAVPSVLPLLWLQIGWEEQVTFQLLILQIQITKAMPFGFIILIYQELHIPRCQAKETNNFYLLIRKNQVHNKFWSEHLQLNEKKRIKKGEKNLKGRRKSLALEAMERSLLNHAYAIKNTM